MNKEIELLKELIKTPSISRRENKTADLIEFYLKKEDFKVYRKYNNVWIVGKIDKKKKTVLLNSHHDTVKPVSDWTKKAFEPEIIGDKLFGLGSNDAGASLVALMSVFIHFEKINSSKYNLIFAATAEEEVSGEKGISSIIKELPSINLAIIGEPTEMKLAIAEKGLMVVDCIAHGKSGHAARNEGQNAIKIAIEDILKIEKLKFNKSNMLGDIKITATEISAGTQHNVIPDKCKYVLDVRTNEKYTNKELFKILQNELESDIKARSFRLNSSSISTEHEFVKNAIQNGIEVFGSSTLSDQSLLNCDSVKIGVGKSKRSHTADEFVRLSEIKKGILIYKNLLKQVDNGQLKI